MIGLAGFAFVFMKALKGREMAQPVALRPLDGVSLSRGEEQSFPAAELSSDEHDQIVELKAIRQASELKITKLEQMIDEKNRIITDFEKGLRSGHDHEVQVEDLKQILQAQIEELKQQNRHLKTESSRLLEENLDLQTKVYAGERGKSVSSDHMQVRPAASTSLLPGTISLHDVFGGEEQKTTS